jgi:di/tricarboxylate transporter
MMLVPIGPVMASLALAIGVHPYKIGDMMKAGLWLMITKE